MKNDETVAQRIIKGTIIIIIVSICAKFTAFITEAVLANYLGTTSESDAYYMVSSIHQVIYPMLSVGIWKVFLPIYKEKVTNGNVDEANTFANKVITLFALVSFIAVLFIIVFSEQIVSIVAPGFIGKTKELCVDLVKISSPMYFFIITSAVYAAMLQCHNRFLGSQIREVVSHIPTIVISLLLFNKFGVYSLAVALVIGGVARLLVEIPFISWNYRYSFDYSYRTSDIILMLKRIPSAFLSEGANQINTLVDKAMASTFPVGAVSGLNYGHRLTNVFSGLLSTAISTATYPQIVEMITLGRNEELDQLIEKIIGLFAVVMFPITCACIVFRRELVIAVFMRGAFDINSVNLTAGIFASYSLGLFFIACLTMFTNVFYGYGDTHTPMIISIIHLFVNVGLNIVLSKLFGINGLALATSLSATISLILSVLFAKKRAFVILKWKSIIELIVRISIASIVACAVAYIIALFITNIFIKLVVAAAIGVICYSLLSYILKISEFKLIINLIIRRIKGK